MQFQKSHHFATDFINESEIKKQKLIIIINHNEYQFISQLHLYK